MQGDAVARSNIHHKLALAGAIVAIAATVPSILVGADGLFEVLTFVAMTVVNVATLMLVAGGLDRRWQTNGNAAVVRLLPLFLHNAGCIYGITESWIYSIGLFWALLFSVFVVGGLVYAYYYSNADVDPVPIQARDMTATPELLQAPPAPLNVSPTWSWTHRHLMISVPLAAILGMGGLLLAALLTYVCDTKWTWYSGLGVSIFVAVMILIGGFGLDRRYKVDKGIAMCLGRVLIVVVVVVVLAFPVAVGFRWIIEAMVEDPFCS